MEWSPAELVYGASLRLPAEFLFPPEDPAARPPTTDFVARLCSALASMWPAPSIHHRRRSASDAPGIPPTLTGVSHVFVGVDAFKRPLTRPYKGPFRVLEKAPKTFVISRAGKSWAVSVDRLKPAWGFVECPVVAAAPPVSSSDRLPVPVGSPATPAPPVLLL